MFFDIEIGIPPREEQDQIEKAVAKKVSHIENAKRSVTAEIEKLNEFRNVIISQAVTGKIKL
jgi:restriction endonuclease S subunit